MSGFIGEIGTGFGATPAVPDTSAQGRLRRLIGDTCDPPDFLGADLQEYLNAWNFGDDLTPDYDFWGAGADCLEEWSARLSSQYDFSSQGVLYKRSQMSAAKQELAVRFRRNARIVPVSAVRNDAWGALR